MIFRLQYKEDCKKDPSKRLALNLQHVAYATLSSISMPICSHCVGHKCWTTRLTAQEFMRTFVLQLAWPSAIPRSLKVTPMQLSGVPPRGLWMKWLDGVHSDKGGRAFAREARVDAFILGTQSGVALAVIPLANHVMQTKMHLIGAEVARDKDRGFSSTADEIGLPWDGVDSFEAISFSACRKSDFLVHQGMLGVGDAFKTDSGLAALELPKSEGIVAAVKGEVILLRSPGRQTARYDF